MHFFVAKLLSIAIMTIHLRPSCPTFTSNEPADLLRTPRINFSYAKQGDRSVSKLARVFLKEFLELHNPSPPFPSPTISLQDLLQTLSSPPFSFFHPSPTPSIPWKLRIFPPHCHLTPSLVVNLFEFLDELLSAKTRALGLFVGEDFVILACVVLTQCQRVTDRRTDGRTNGL